MEEKKIVGFFEERAGVYSSQRLIFIVGNFYAMLLGAFVLYKSDGADWAGAMTIVITISGTFGLQKLSQKRTEVKAELNQKNESTDK
jgi:hypothetical protein